MGGRLRLVGQGDWNLEPVQHGEEGVMGRKTDLSMSQGERGELRLAGQRDWEKELGRQTLNLAKESGEEGAGVRWYWRPG